MGRELGRQAGPAVGRTAEPSEGRSAKGYKTLQFTSTERPD